MGYRIKYLNQFEINVIGLGADLAFIEDELEGVFDDDYDIGSPNPLRNIREDYHHEYEINLTSDEGAFVLAWLIYREAKRLIG